MSGIAGIFRRNAEADEADEGLVRGMLGPIVRRGPDAEGLVREGRLTLGHRRLALHHRTDAVAQPVLSRDGNLLLGCDGEIYNFEELREEIGIDPGDLRSSSDAEILLVAWERFGPDTLDRLVGHWAFALYDRVTRKLVLARDRFGEKPLFYHADSHALTFASSIQALFQVNWVPAELDEEALTEYITMGYVVSPRTVMRSIRKVPPGYLLQVGGDGIRLSRWYRPRFARRSGTIPGRREMTEEFGERLVRAVDRCTGGDVPVALLLSNGINSRSIRAALDQAGHKIPSLTCYPAERLPGGDPDLDPPEPTGRVLLRFSPGTRLDDMEGAFADLVEPVGDAASLATWLLVREARPHATVFLCGHGGDAILGGYRLSHDRFRLAAMARMAWMPGGWVDRFFDRYANGAETPERRRRLLKSSGRFVPAAARYLAQRPLSYADACELLGGPPLPEPYLKTVDYLYSGCSVDASILDRAQEVMVKTALANCILSWSDSMSAAFSAEMRMPFLDRDLVELVMGLPSRARVSRWPGEGNTKRILRWWARGRIPEQVRTAPPKPFPYGALRQVIASFREEIPDRILAAPALRRALPGLESWLRRSPGSGGGRRGRALWSLHALGVWLESAGAG